MCHRNHVLFLCSIVRGGRSCESSCKTVNVKASWREVPGFTHHILFISVAFWAQSLHSYSTLAWQNLCYAFYSHCPSMPRWVLMEARWNPGVWVWVGQHVSLFLSSRTVSEPEDQLPDAWVLPSKPQESLFWVQTKYPPENNWRKGQGLCIFRRAWGQHLGGNWGGEEFYLKLQPLILFQRLSQDPSSGPNPISWFQMESQWLSGARELTRPLSTTCISKDTFMPQRHWTHLEWWKKSSSSSKPWLHTPQGNIGASIEVRSSGQNLVTLWIWW